MQIGILNLTRKKIDSNSKLILTLREKINSTKKKLLELYKGKQYFAVIVKGQLDIAKLLRQFADIVASNDSFGLKEKNIPSSLAQECVEYVSYYDQHIEQLINNSTIDLATHIYLDNNRIVVVPRDLASSSPDTTRECRAGLK